jgi:hypothetical protein
MAAAARPRSQAGAALAMSKSVTDNGEGPASVSARDFYPTLMGSPAGVPLGEDASIILERERGSTGGGDDGSAMWPQAVLVITETELVR